MLTHGVKHTSLHLTTSDAAVMSEVGARVQMTLLNGGIYAVVPLDGAPTAETI